VAKRGRPKKATSSFRNPVNVAANHANALLELWLADAPHMALLLLRPLLERSPEHKALLVECLRARRPDELRRTVPKKIKRKLCELAVAHVVEQHRQGQASALQIKDSLRRAKAGAEAELRRRCWTDEQIAGWFKKLRAAAQRRSVKKFTAPDVYKVLEIVNRRAPAITLRRKAADRRKAGCRILRRKMRAA
jgi:hypothetical protein